MNSDTKKTPAELQLDEGRNGIHMGAGSDDQRTPYDPFADADERGVEIIRQHLPEGYLGVSSPDAGRVWLDSRLLQSEARSTLAHELAHFDVNERTPGRLGGGTRGGVVKSVERECDRIAATRLIDFDALVSAAQWADSVEEMADELNVDPGMVLARIGALTGAEATRFERAVGRLHHRPTRSTLSRRTPLRKVGSKR